MDNKITLDKWLRDAPETAYPNHQKFDYYTLYSALKIKTTDLHKNVAPTANYQESLKHDGRIDILLNDHGDEHIKRVVQRATDLLEKCSGGSNGLSPKEVYYLLCAIEIHDLGNFYGRTGHEDQIAKVIFGLGQTIGLDDVERRYIKQIAEAHGGRTKNGDKDRIAKLEPFVFTSNEKVRLRLLAAVLRFADELADDKTRANNKALEEGLLPKGSEIYHAYSRCLDSVNVEHETKTVKLHFEVPVEDALKKFGKESQDVDLIDEIYHRVLKMHLERLYTMHFMKGCCDFEKIWVRIRFYKSFLDDDIISPITFEVKQKGYPDSNGSSIFDICNELLDAKGSKMNGEYVRQLLNSKS